MQRRTPSAQKSGNHADYRARFVHCVHELLQCGYERMQPVSGFEYWKEEEISGELHRHIDDLLDELRKPWMRFYSLAPERHVDEPHLDLKDRRLGKRRKRLDFRFNCRQRKPVQRFIFEAKSLKQSRAAQLLDEDGLGRILSGHYARNDTSAGLLGYVQNATAEFHAASLRKELSENGAAYGITTDGHWTVMKLTNGPAHVFCTKHHRGKLGEVTIYITLLLFR